MNAGCLDRLNRHSLAGIYFPSIRYDRDSELGRSGQWKLALLVILCAFLSLEGASGLIAYPRGELRGLRREPERHDLEDTGSAPVAFDPMEDGFHTAKDRCSPGYQPAGFFPPSGLEVRESFLISKLPPGTRRSKNPVGSVAGVTPLSSPIGAESMDLARRS